MSDYEDEYAKKLERWERGIAEGSKQSWTYADGLHAQKRAEAQAEAFKSVVRQGQGQVRPVFWAGFYAGFICGVVVILGLLTWWAMSRKCRMLPYLLLHLPLHYRPPKALVPIRRQGLILMEAYRLVES